MTANVAGDLTPAGRKADKCDGLQIERLQELREVVGIGVHVVSAPWLTRSPMTATVMGNAPKTVGAQKQHLRFPTIGIEGPTVAEHHRLSAAPVFVVDFCSVFDGHHTHGYLHCSLFLQSTRNPLRS